MANVVSDEMYNQLKQLYWWDAGKASKAKAQVESSYTTEKYNQLVNQLNSLYGSWASSSTPKTTTTTTKTSTPQTTVETYRWVVDNPNTSWTSNMNSMSQSSAQYNSRNAQVNTGDVVEMPQQPKVSSVQQPSQDNFAKSWNSLTASQQISALTWNKQLTDYINSKWLTVKKEETPVTTTTKPKQTTYTTPKQQEWDYQDNSQARMDEIARNLNWFRQTNPELFQDPSTFYGFFIDWKGRSQDQIDYLWNYYDRVKKYSKYDNMPASALWEWLADGTIPQDYLDYIKWVDPQKYQEILSYKQDWEDRIKNESYLDDLTSMAWFESEESKVNVYPDAVTYAREMWYFVDEDWNWVDDNLYVQPTDEERQDVDRINEINARRMEIKNMQKNLLDDLVEQYPWVPKATLMGIVQDRTKDISREYDDLWVELVQLQGTVDYLQNERSMQSEARQKTIQNLDNAYWMYYQYSPWGIAELAQSKYAATNITLDQADSGNETQKQMALQNVLDWYYEKYWDIIQRSEQQVINDVIAYAKKSWIWLAQALQENFVQPLQSKPEFAAISSGRKISDWVSDKWSITTVKDANWEDMSVMYNQNTGEIRSLWGDYVWNMWVSTPWTPSKTDYWKSYTVVSQEQLVNWLDTFLGDYEIWSTWWQCWAFINNWLKSIWVISENIYDNNLDSKLKSKNEEADANAQTGWVAIYDPSQLTWNWAKYWHVGWVVKDNWDGTVAILDSNWTKNPTTWEYDGTVWYHPSVSKDKLYGYFNPTKSNWEEEWDLYYAKVLWWIPTQLRNTDVEKQWYLDIAKEQREKWLSPFEAAMSIIWFDITNKDQKAQSLKNKVLDIIQQQWSETLFDQAVLSSMASFINQWKYEKALETLENQLGSYMKQQWVNGLERDSVTSAMRAVDDLNNIKKYQWRTKWGVNTVAEAIWAEWKSTANFQVWVSSVKRTLKALWYDDEDIDNIVPKLTNDKATFNARVSALENAILSQYNILRANHWLPSLDKSWVLKQTPLSEIYKVWYVTVEPYQLSNRDFNLRYSISSENEAFNAI